jgi:hypothetical protein
MCLANEPAETRVVLRANVAPVRSVPIHSAVMAEGFGAYVASLPPGLLFATVKLDRDGRAGNNASHTLNAWLNEIGITDPRLVFHSWRHTFKTMARAVMTEELIAPFRSPVLGCPDNRQINLAAFAAIITPSRRASSFIRARRGNPNPAPGSRRRADTGIQCERDPPCVIEWRMGDHAAVFLQCSPSRGHASNPRFGWPVCWPVCARGHNVALTGILNRPSITEESGGNARLFYPIAAMMPA